MKKYYCYILWSPQGQKFYIGITENLDQRLLQHNNSISKWTKRFAGTWQLVWHKEFSDITAVRKFENLLKKQKGGNKFYELTNIKREDFKDNNIS